VLAIIADLGRRDTDLQQQITLVNNRVQVLESLRVDPRDCTQLAAASHNGGGASHHDIYPNGNTTLYLAVLSHDP
jgi:hypothetical protein